MTRNIEILAPAGSMEGLIAAVHGGCDAVYIGDSDVDVETAKQAGMDGIFVSWGFRGRTFLQEHGAERIADAPKELEEELLTKEKGTEKG